MDDSNKGKWFTALETGGQWDARVFFRFFCYRDEMEHIQYTELVVDNRYIVENGVFHMEELDEVEDISANRVRVQLTSFKDKERFQENNPDTPKDCVPAREHSVMVTDGYKTEHTIMQDFGEDLDDDGNLDDGLVKQPTALI